MAKRKLILRADGGLQLGMGHFIRTLALGEMLKDDFYCIYVTRNPSDYQCNEVNKVCEELIELPEDDSHFEKFLELLKGNEIVVLDNYYFDTDYQRKIKYKGCKLVCIDDMHDKHYVADVVINHAEGIKAGTFSTEDYTKLCLGFKYALLRKPFLEHRKEDANKEFDIMIGLGGSDPSDITFRLIEKLVKLNSISKMAILLGNSYEGKADQFEDSNIRFFKSVSDIEVCNLMGMSKFGIFPASTIAIEAVAMRLPFFIGYFIENQLEIFSGIVKDNAGIEAGDFHVLNEGNLAELIADYLDDQESTSEIISNQNRILDKQSASRIVDVFNSLL